MKVEHKVLICHYRIGSTDGVSLEIDKRKEVLEGLGCEVALLGGAESRGADFIIPQLDFDLPLVRKISRNAFGGFKDWNSEDELLSAIEEMADSIKNDFLRIIRDWKPGFILLHNIFSHGRHIAAARGVCEALGETGIPSLATHHDFYWEREDFLEPSSPGVETFLAEYVPPRVPGLRHAVINSLAAENLLLKKGLSAMIIPDTLDFNISPWVKDDYNKDLLPDFGLREEDILILQATRIVPRKGIELIPPILKKLNSPEFLGRLTGKPLYNGKVVRKDSRFVFILAGFTEGEALVYQEKLVKLMDRDEVPYRFIRSRIGAARRKEEGGKTYSLFDTYPYADLVSYPSFFEGWGNQFIEAVFARKPILLFEYPVYKADIKSKGYRVVSLGDETELDSESGFQTLTESRIRQTCEQTVETLLSGETVEMMEYNFRLAKENNSFQYLQALMKRGMEHWDDSI